VLRQRVSAPVRSGGVSGILGHRVDSGPAFQYLEGFAGTSTAGWFVGL
jgi:hypothetical protein